MALRHFKIAAAAVGVMIAFAFVYDRVFHVQPVENPPAAYRLNQGDGQTEADGLAVGRASALVSAAARQFS